MKKVIISMMLLVTGMTTVFAADATIRAKVTMGAYDLVVREGADWSAAFDNGVDAYAYGAGGVVVSASGSRYESFATNNLEGAAIEFTPAAANVTFEFSAVIGDLYLVDNGVSPVVRKKIVDGESYNFTVAADKVNVADASRFYFSKVAGKEICYKYEALEISDYNGWNLTVTEKGQASPTINVPIESDYFKQSLADKNAGYYVVKLSKSGETDIEYIISVKPTVVPAN